MERDAGVRANAFLAGAQGAEVLGRSRHDIREQFHRHSPFQLTSNRHVQEAPRVRRRHLRYKP